MEKKLSIVFLCWLMLSSVSSATIVLTEPELYDYIDLYLLKTLPNKNAACFATSDGKVFLVRRGAYVGKEFAKVAEIQEHAVVVSGMVQLNGGDWYERKFRWPVTTEIRDLENLLKRCEEKELQR